MSTTVSRPVVSPFGREATADDVLRDTSMAGKRVLVTGGASGLGAATVRALANAGAEVTIATRRPEHGRAIVEEFPTVRSLPLELTDLSSVAGFARNWDGPLDVLVANAGVMAIPERRVTAAGWELQLATNYLGHFALALGLHENLAAAGGARVVILSSGVQLYHGVDLDDLQFERRDYDPMTAYSQSKSASVLLGVGIGRHWSDEGITGNALTPGFIHTGLARHIPDETKRALGILDDSGALITPDYFKTPEQGAATSVFLASSPLVEGVSGAYFEDNQEQPVVVGGADVHVGVAEWSVDPATADALWDAAAAVVNG